MPSDDIMREGFQQAMLRLGFCRAETERLRLLCLGAHSDDIEIGCGGSVLRLVQSEKVGHVDWVVLGSCGKRSEEARHSAERFLSGVESRSIIVKGFRDSFFPYCGTEIKEFFEEMKSWQTPDIIFTHFGRDAHQDHRLVSELTWNTWRNHLILEYEIIKYDGDLQSPNFYVHLSSGVSRKKIDLIVGGFKTQQHRDWFSRDAFLAVMRMRGVESRAPDGVAEGFYCRKAVL